MESTDTRTGFLQRKKLTSDALRALWRRNPTPEVRVLLWEIHRLQDIARQAQYVNALARTLGVARPFQARLAALESALFAEPCLWERPLDWSSDEARELKRLSRGRR